MGKILHTDLTIYPLTTGISDDIIFPHKYI